MNENNIPIADFPEIDECRTIVTEFMEERELSRRGRQRTLCTAGIPFVVTSERISIDGDKINEMGLFCSYEERDRSFDDTVIRPFRWGGNYSASVLSEDPEWEREYHRDQLIEYIAQEIYNACRKGFIARDIYGSREEQIDRSPVPKPLTEYVEGGEIPEVDLPDREERQYTVGTRRYGIRGVITDRAWWRDQAERAVQNSEKQIYV